MLQPSLHHLDDLRYREAKRLVWSPGSNLSFNPVVVIPIAPGNAPDPVEARVAFRRPLPLKQVADRVALVVGTPPLNC